MSKAIGRRRSSRKPPSGRSIWPPGSWARRKRQRLLVWASIPLLGIVFVGCGSGPPASERPPAAAGTATVAIEDLAFAPAEQIVQVGTTVQWLWDDGAIAHNVVGDGWASEVQQAGTFSQRFDQPGDYPYLCTLHPNMTGTIEVRK